MSDIKYIKGNLFDAPKGSILIHACNCVGLWGSGIARQFATKFPSSYTKYQRLCHRHGTAVLGKCLYISEDPDYDIACLMTSRSYGRNIDPPDQILKATKTAIQELISFNVNNKELHACKINSGLFRVPWDETEAILKETGVPFTVYEL
jgi:ADP-ribose 1''-phosphate phosphatase